MAPQQSLQLRAGVIIEAPTVSRTLQRHAVGPEYYFYPPVSDQAAVRELGGLVPRNAPHLVLNK